VSAWLVDDDVKPENTASLTHVCQGDAEGGSLRGDVLYLLFFFSGASALIYEVVWVRVFANVFGNTIYSASIVTAVFMLGLGIGSYAAGGWADRGYTRRNLLQVFAAFELAIGVSALAISVLLPHLGDFSAAVSSYTRGDHGWYVLSAASYAARAAIAIVLLTPVTMLMGGTLTLLIRHLLRSGADLSGPRIGILYGVNTLGAAAGCFLTDFALVPSYGLRNTQLIAVATNVITATGALLLVRLKPPASASPKHQEAMTRPTRSAPLADLSIIAASLAMTGFAGMGMEILWFRNFSILLGAFRAVFSLLLAVILLGIGAGSLAGGYLQRRTRQPARVLMIVQGLFVVATLTCLASADAVTINRAGEAYAARHPAAATSDVNRELAELWFNGRPILLVVALPALLMGFAFPLANAIVQRAEATVGRRAGVLYLANTCGAVCGSLATGFLLLPMLGMQRSATVLMIAALASAVPLVRIPVGDRFRKTPAGAVFGRTFGTVGVSFALGIGAIAVWLSLPSDYLLSRVLFFPLQRALTISDGINELIAVTTGPAGGRVLVTNGHPMSSSELMSQRYMRAMAHVPLLALHQPQRVLVLCFGVGNTAHAATLHPTVQRVEIVDLSRDVLEHASYFADTNDDVLNNPRVAVYVNDGRHHLQMRAGRENDLYDLITLEPPPIVHAGVAALYTTEFYERARERLKPGGYLTQWLPSFGVPQSMILSMVRSFIDVFPNAVLLSGASANLLLMGTSGPRNEIEPHWLEESLAKAPAVHADLKAMDLGTPREIVGMFVASSARLAAATRNIPPVTDDRPIQEYGKKSLLNSDEGIPPSIIDVGEVAAWCPACFASGKPVTSVEGLDTYLSMLDLAYRAYRIGPAQTVPPGSVTSIAGSGYLGSVVPQSSELNAVLRGAFIEKYQRGTDLLVARHYPEAINALRSALIWNDKSAEAHNNLGIALASTGRTDEAIDQFRLALRIDPEFDDAKRNLAMATRRE
jgi:spermidine synthase